MPSHVKGARGRDYAAEYAARKARASARGLSLAQARGHASKGESITELRSTGVITTTGGGRPDTTLSRFYQAIDSLAQGKSMHRAAKDAGISPSTVKRLNRERQLYQPNYHYKEGKPTTVHGYEVAYSGSTPILTSDGRLIMAPEVDARNASILGTYWNAVEAALKGNAQALRQFAHTTVYDAHGTTYRLMTNVNAIRRFFDEMSEEDEGDFWRTFYTGRTIHYAPAA